MASGRLNMEREERCTETNISQQCSTEKKERNKIKIFRVRKIQRENNEEQRGAAGGF